MRAAIVLAAGASRRFGYRDKLRTRLQGRSLLHHVVANAQLSGAKRIIVVVSRATRMSGVTVVRARQAKRGLSASLRIGLAALRPVEREVLIFLADMPFARAPHMVLEPDMAAIRPRFRGDPGHPMLVRVAAARKAWTAGDAGFAGKLQTAFVRGNAGNIIDIDTQASLRVAIRYGSRAPGRRSSFS
ncbi:nucleotidyltransferase family protein [Sphingomonas crusticola]|uniref:nucleotidyltransferase family protein n=1 Tax=Sphingomonas crusticola TaxID=1697973 RepID=UPI000E265CDF|nr:NTP transferase domain-containing protein [Sphingomonas crusticola]